MKKIRKNLAWILALVTVLTNINYVKADDLSENVLSDVVYEMESVSVNNVTSDGIDNIMGSSEDTIAFGTYRGMDWVIDGEGMLTISGTYDYDDSENWREATWLEYSSFIKSAKVTAKEVKSTDYWFSYCEELISVDMSEFDTSNVTDMSGMFFGCSSLTSLDLDGLDTSNVTHMVDIFHGCSSLISVDMSGMNASRVKNMFQMFSGCSSLINVNLNDIDTSSVTSMSNMFFGCSSLISLDLSSLDTGNVTSMDSMFSNCSSLTSLNLDGLDTSSVTRMRAMFSNCSSLTVLDLRSLNTENVTDMGFMFSGCNRLTELDLSDFKTDSATDMMWMFENCSSLTSLDLDGIDTSSVRDMTCMFSGCSSLTSLDLEGIDTGNVTSMEGMFSGCSSLTSLDLDGLDTSSVTDMSGMFYDCSSLTSLDLSGFKTDNVTDMGSMFNSCINLTSLDVSNFNTGSVESMGWMFYKCSSLTSLDLSGFDTGSVTDMSDMFWACNSIRQIKTFPNLQIEVKLPKSPMYDEDGKEYTDFFPTGLSEGIWLYASESNNVVASGTFRGMNWSIDKNGLLIISGQYNYGGTQQEEPAWLQYSSSIKRAKVTATGVKSTFRWFEECSGLTDVDFSGFDSSKVTDMKFMFYGCSSLTELDLSGFKTDSAIDMEGMFAYCNGLTSLNVSGFHTDNVTTMSHMFLECENLKSLDVSGFHTENVTDMSAMFTDCSGLISLDVRNFKTDSVTDMGGMFDNCSSLTSLDVSNFITDNVTDMGGMFCDCSGLTSLDVSNFNTGNVESMLWMFYNCSSLTSLDLSGFDTGSVTDMSGMFYDCGNLRDVDLSSFDTSSVTDMSMMFGNCNSLTSLDLSCFDTENVMDTWDMLAGCSSISQIKTLPNLRLEVILPVRPMYDANLQSYQYMPTGLTRGIWLYASEDDARNAESELTYTVTFDSGLGDEPIQITDILSGTKIALPEQPVREGYTFQGWFTQPDGKGRAFTEKSYVNSDLYLYAYWKVGQPASKEGFWVSPVEPQTYTGSAIKPAVEVYDGELLLTEKVDYTISYKNNTKVNDAAVEKTAPSIIITGRGSYSGKITVYFPIVAKSVEDFDVSVEDIFAAPTGKVQTPVPTVTWQNKKLSNKKDFEVSYPDLEDSTKTDAYKAAGAEYRVKIKGINNFAGERTIYFHITTATLMSKVKVKAIPKQTYTGSAIEPSLTVTCGKEPLSLGTDYTVSYKNNIAAGKATAVLTGKGDYAGTKEVTFQIVGSPIAKATVNGLTDKVYNGQEQTQNIQVQLDTKTLTQDKDYQISYTKNLNVGTATVTITGIGGYSGTVKKTFKITAYDLSVDESHLIGGFPKDGMSVSYTKGGCTPEANLSFNGVELAVKKDYTVSYSNNKKITDPTDVKKPTITIKGKGNFKGTKTISFNITKRNLTEEPVDIVVSDMPYVNKAGKYISKPVLTDSNGKKLAAGTDYEKTITYTLTDTGEALDKTSIPAVRSSIKVTITGKGSYEGTMEATYRIATSSFSSAKITITPQSYTGSAVTLTEKDITVKLGKDTVLTYGKDYEIVEGSYQNNVKKGTASVMIKGIGDYAGTKTVKFKITSKKMD